MLHPLTSSLERPSRFNNPFDYEPHPLCKLAADEVARFVTSQPQLNADAQRGKMFGVLVVEADADANGQGRLAYLAAYSGLLAGRNDWDFFVPSVFDAQQPDGHFKTMERQISAINAEIAHCDEARAADLKQQRKRMSEELQLWLFRQYRMLNARGETKDLVDIWRDYHTSPKLQQRFPLPPGGSGDCCAPKLLQCAYQHHWQPVAMAEFWMGESPRGEIRHDGHYYPACRGKCLPILTFMLQGLEVEKEGPASASAADVQVVYEDAAVLVVDKPSGMLTVPGKALDDSLLSRYQLAHPEASGPIVVHRLDQETSGLVVFAKDKAVHKALQQQFEAHTIQKQYVALLEGLVLLDEGVIDLPIRPDVDDRPRQRVDYGQGKPAVTRYRVLERRDGHTLIALQPLTGRTHQLRVHCSHPQGLNCPIVGDRLYGRASSRLMLHARSVTFDHPATGRSLCITCPVPFL